MIVDLNCDGCCVALIFRQPDAGRRSAILEIIRRRRGRAAERRVRNLVLQRLEEIRRDCEA